MNFEDIFPNCHLSEYKQFAKNEWVRIHNIPGRIAMNMHIPSIPLTYRQYMCDMKDDHNGIGYVYIANELYNKGMKVIKPTLEQCLAFENVEINIPFKEYQQPFETILIEFPDKYKSLLQSRFERKSPSAIICHKPVDKEYMIGSALFGKHTFIVTFFMTNYNSIMENLIKSENKNEDKDFLPVAQAERVTFNINLFMTHFGHTKLGYENIKQHRFRVRKRPDLAKQDFYYIGLKQEIKFYEKKIYKQSQTENEFHASPAPHWRRGYWRQQHHGPGNSLIKTIFIHAVFVCSEKYKGDMTDTSVTYV
jgi:hypothetical protein